MSTPSTVSSQRPCVIWRVLRPAMPALSAPFLRTTPGPSTRPVPSEAPRSVQPANMLERETDSPICQFEMFTDLSLLSPLKSVANEVVFATFMPVPLKVCRPLLAAVP